MSVESHASAEFVQPPPGGRVFTQRRRPLLGDCAPSGRIRLDALARMLQDVAYMDVDDAGVAEFAVWVVRRSRMLVNRFPGFGEHLELVTFCSGLGKMWAERRTTVTSGEQEDACVEAVSLWVHLDPESWRPVPFTEAEIVAYGDAAAGRKITARLRHPPPASGADHSPWRFRSIDCDIAGHVNNAAYWEPLEEELLTVPDPDRLDVEMEFRTPAQPGEMRFIRDGTRRWIASPEGDTHASIAFGDL
jgi:acyl-ACP thioesterase